MGKSNLIIVCMVIFMAACTNQDQSGIMPYTKNPNYWQYNGEPIFLVGGSDRDNIFQWADKSTKLSDHLDILKACEGNYIRCTMSSREYMEQGYRWDVLPFPYEKLNGKFDLSTWNEEYWHRFHIFLAETQKRGIIVQLELWDRWNESGDSESNSPETGRGWYESPYNPNNNSSYSWEECPLLKKGRTAFYNSFHYAAVEGDSILLKYQQQFAKKVIDEVIDNDFNHVIFQVDNESGIGDNDLEPDPYWANYIREYGRSKSRSHPVYVCTSRRFHFPSRYLTTNFQDWDNPEIRIPIENPAFNFCDISQNNGNSGQAHYDNFLWYRNRVHMHGIRPINNVKCYHFNWPTGYGFHEGRSSPTDEEALSKFWRVVFAGAASIRFHRDTPYKSGKLREGFGLSIEGQTHIKSIGVLLDAIDIFKMEPSNGLISGRSDNEAYCLAEPEKQYAVFFTGQGDRSIAIDLWSAKRKFDLKWLDISRSNWHFSQTIMGGGEYGLTAPDQKSLWVAVMIAR